MKHKPGTFAETGGKYVYNEQYHQNFKHNCNEDKVGDLILLYVKRGQCTWFSLDRNRF